MNNDQSMATETGVRCRTTEADSKAAPNAGGVHSSPGVLLDAMLALHDVLSELEIEYENTVAAANLCPSRRQRRGLEMLADRYHEQLTKLRQFFDWDVYLDRMPATEAKS